MSDVTSRIPKYEALFQKVAADYSPMPLMIDDRFIRAVAMAFAELDARVERLDADAKLANKQIAELLEVGRHD